MKKLDDSKKTHKENEEQMLKIEVVERKENCQVLKFGSLKIIRKKKLNIKALCEKMAT